MFVVDDGFLNRLQTLNDEFLNLLIALIDFFLSVSTHQVELHTSEIPLSTQFVIITLGCFLDGHIGQVHEGVAQVVQIV